MSNIHVIIHISHIHIIYHKVIKYNRNKNPTNNISDFIYALSILFQSLRTNAVTWSKSLEFCWCDIQIFEALER